VETSVFRDLDDARKRIGHFMDHYNFHRPHQGIGGLTPSERFFGAAPEVLKTLKARVEANAIELARRGIPADPFFVTGRSGGRNFSVHAEGERLVMTKEGDEPREVELVATEPEEESVPDPVSPHGEVGEDDPGQEEPPGPGESPLDEAMQRIHEAFGEEE
jgi:hypothetical protein